MKNQRGAALVVVMALLSGALMLGMSGMQSALIDERLAGNYRATTQARMNAERAISDALEKFKSDESDNKSSWDDARVVEELNEDNDFFKLGTVVDSCSDSDKCGYEFLRIDDEYKVVARGAVVNKELDRIIAESAFIVIDFEVNLSGGGVSNNSVANILNSVFSTGDLINVIGAYEFSSSGNKQAKSWENKISVDEKLFVDANEACLFRDALVNREVAQGVVEVVSGSINGKGLSELSGNIVVVNDDNFSLPNASEFSGVLMVFGRDFNITGGGNIGFDGVIIHVPINCDNKTFYTPRIDIRGGNGSYNSSAVQSIINQLDIEQSGGGGSTGDSEVSSNRDLDIRGWLWSFE